MVNGGKKRTIERRIPVPLLERAGALPLKRGQPPEMTRKTPDVALMDLIAGQTGVIANFDLYEVRADSSHLPSLRRPG